VTLSSNDPGEGIVLGEPHVFDSETWDIPRNVNLEGVDDSIDDGDVSYQINASVASDDLVYADLSVDPLAVTNVDDDTAGITVGAISGNTDESGDQATFTVKLDSEPVAGVTVTLTGDPTEGSLDPAELTFTDQNWFEAQTITVTGLSDDEADGSVTYNVTFAVTSVDSKYNEMVVDALAVTNDDAIQCAGLGFSENFDDGLDEAWQIFASTLVEVSGESAASGSSTGLAFIESGSAYLGMGVGFASSTPTYVSVHMRADGSSLNGRNYFVLGDDNVATNEGVIHLFANGSDWVVADSDGNTRLTEIVPNTYEHFEFYLDWNARTYDIYRGGGLLEEGQPFRNPTSTDVTQLHLFNLDIDAVAEYDEISIGCGI
jgi:hypothetical protein